MEDGEWRMETGWRALAARAQSLLLVSDEKHIIDSLQILIAKHEVLKQSPFYNTILVIATSAARKQPPFNKNRPCHCE